MVKTYGLNFIITQNGFVVDGEEDAILMDEEKSWKKKFEEDRYDALYQLGLKNSVEGSRSFVFLHHLSKMFFEVLLQTDDLEILRNKVEIFVAAEVLHTLQNSSTFLMGEQYLDHRWLKRQWNALLRIFAKEIEIYPDTVTMYFTEKNQDLRVPGRIFFHLVENKGDDYPFAFMATYSSEENPARVSHIPLMHALTEYRSQPEELLKLMSSLGKAAKGSTMVSRLMDNGQLFYPLKFTAKEAYTFFQEIPIFQEAGILCRIPDWWKKKRQAVSLEVVVGEKKKTYLGVDNLIRVRPKLSVDGEEITQEELRQLLRSTQGLTLLKGKWVEVDRDKLKQILATYDKLSEDFATEGLTLQQALAMELRTKDVFSGVSDKTLTITQGQWLTKLKEQMSNPVVLDKSPLPSSFQAKLRPYQRVGTNWLRYMQELGFGACLADDMGLGKTVQIIGFLESFRVKSLDEQSVGRALLILPASLLGNWESELQKFSPQLDYQICHGKVSEEDLCQENLPFLTITTYGKITKSEAFGKVNWDIIILDEAQAIKNPGTKQTKAVKQLPGKMKIALTGTPIENRLSDLWSLFDFLNAGLLGSAKEFTALAKTMDQDAMQAERIKRSISPFLLRRLKTDKKIISDLPEKVEIKEQIFLSKKQISLYHELVSHLEDALSQTDGIQRKGLVLTTLLKCKQICNHPDHYLGQTGYKEGESGKLVRLKEICQTIYEKRERVIIFTQFKEMTQPLASFLEQVFHRKGLVLHGGTPVKKRTAMVKQFNAEEYTPFMVLSLKAGGVGLNLTSANHVIHFDRWWNPAVENQATDRAFRIGQKKNVMVYKMVAKDTVEERIDQMIADKEKLAQEIIGAAKETWITELGNEELMQMFRMK